MGHRGWTTAEEPRLDPSATGESRTVFEILPLMIGDPEPARIFEAPTPLFELGITFGPRLSRWKPRAARE